MSNKTLPKIYTLSNYQKVNNVLVMGCGGTGAYIVSHLARLIKVFNGQRTRLFLADGDVVEKKNLLRQHFISSEISKNKAIALAERYSMAFGLEIFAVPKDIEKIDDFNVLNDNNKDNWSDLVIGCVDNNASRKLVNEWFNKRTNNYHSKFWIDCGNEERFGQVVCGYTPPMAGSYGGIRLNLHDNKKSYMGEFSLPNTMEIYPNLMEENAKFNSELSCAERAISAPQNIQTNVTASTIALNYIPKVLLGMDIKSHCVEFTIDNIFSTKLNTIENLSVVNANRLCNWEKK